MNSSDYEVEKTIFLHGDLELCIVKAKGVPKMDLWTNTSDPYVTVVIAGNTVARTRVIPDSTNPVWEENFNLTLCHDVSEVEFFLKDKDLIGVDAIGTVKVQAKWIAPGTKIDDWFPVRGSTNCSLHLRMQFKPAEKIYPLGIPGEPDDNLGVKHTYFPARKVGKLRLYQDAHVSDGQLPRIDLESGKVFRHENCWEDICDAISEAQYLVYVVGWSIYDKVKLKRRRSVEDPTAGYHQLTLGELLKNKSGDDVRVRLLVWDDKTSNDGFLFKTEGVAKTHDEETRKFFKNSSVLCVLSPRSQANSKRYLLKKQSTLFSHHQKCVIVDTQASQGKRQITAFLGGLDLCDGRYDTPEHTLFRDLDTVFENDFRNPVFPTETRGPRQPWHDLHCRIDGPAAHDVLQNFEQRWNKKSNDDTLIKIDRMPSILRADNALITTEDDPLENWHVQVFRSIDSGSLEGFPTDPQQARKENLICKNNLVVDKSIHTAYVAAIRSAQHFIYIENQYFLGSSFSWPPDYKSSGANNLVPMELALKVASKIRANERFAIYVVIPMWPEGVPTDAAVQKLLFWQCQTIQMMYDIISKELKSFNVEGAHPQDYLNFYCLGNKEDPVTPSSNTPYQKFGRFMVHVNGKGMIVDDEYVILGSANINQRSLDGSGDTEIAVGAYQQHHSWSKKKSNPRGQVFGYRMSLWAEHLGMVDDDKPDSLECVRKVNDIFTEPDSLECVRKVNEIAEGNWKKFCGEEEGRLQGHLLKYPITVGSDGKVGTIRDRELFPDVGGKILGTPAHLPDDLMM